MAWFTRKKDEDVVEEVVEEVRLPEPPPLGPSGLRSFADHRDYLLTLVEPLKPFGMPLLDAWDQVMCEDVDSMVNVPPNSTAKVDGFAVRATDLLDNRGRLAEPLRIVDLNVDRLPVGAAAAVTTGEVLPRGANAVLPSTFATVEGHRAHLLDHVLEGDYVRAAGEHLELGTRLMSEGEVLDERRIGLLASAGIDKVMVRPRPRVVVISSGERLAEPGNDIAHGETVDTNSYMIAAAARAAGATVFRVAVHSNDQEALSEAITDQLIRADLVISTTGGKREDYEAVATVMSKLGLVDTVSVAMTPGRTQTFGLVGEDRVPMLMLPGNPVSAYVSFQAFAWPVIQRLGGLPTERQQVRAIASNSMRSMRGQMHLLRGEVVSDGAVRHVEQVAEPYALGELARCNALVVLDEDTDGVRPGGPIKVWLLGKH